MASLTMASRSTFVPALKPPPGITSNPNHPSSWTRLASILVAACITLYTIAFVLRCYVRFYMKRLFILEDAMCIVLWAGMVAHSAILLHNVTSGGGMHEWDISPEVSHKQEYWFFVGSLLYSSLMGLAKVAVLSLYRRVFSPRKRTPFDIMIKVLAALIICFCIIYSSIRIFSCRPREKIWNPSLPGKCVNFLWILYMGGGLNVISDWVILLLPLHAVYHLQMRIKKKILVAIVFTFGACAPICATAGLIGRITISDKDDHSWYRPGILVWGAGELTSGMIILCLPELAPLFRLNSHSSRNAPHQPSPATIRERNRRQAARRGPSDPYISNSLMETTIIGDERPYIELTDLAKNARAAPYNGGKDQLETIENRISVRTDIKVETSDIAQRA
ncbi:unnamed protein product [Periconia digitata]|uniref:Rhodopsin domain-containing protein n=1 Tax=Periconia digitata TaxID=1303443 RepID=A0A9W4UQ11_9PLEO|nr:unnamed protein product [Periconia digitata]